MKPIHSCEHLELRVNEEDKGIILSYIKRLEGKDSVLEDYQGFLRFLKAGRANWPFFGMFYEPRCRKTDEVCIVMESPIISMQTTRGMYQPLTWVIMNSRRIPKCEDREFPTNSFDGYESPNEFLIRRVLSYFARERCEHKI